MFMTSCHRDVSATLAMLEIYIEGKWCCGGAALVMLGRERLWCRLETVRPESCGYQTMAEPVMVENVAGVDHVPESRQNASCYWQETINKNEGDSDDDRVGGCWR